MLTFLRNACAGNAQPRSPHSPLGYRIAPDVKASVHPGGIVLIHLERGIVFSANRAGAMIWNGVAQHWTLGRVASSISGEFHISRESAEQDATEFLEGLAAEGLVISDLS